MILRIMPAAYRDLNRAMDFYEAQNLGLSAYFLESLSAEIESLRLYAGIHPRFHRHYRMLASRFPFAIYYKLEQQTVTVWRVLDCRQDPISIRRALRPSR
ncbi:MAG: hypothetical protein RL095_1132 [Verrucomicrobiota bacterium]|jgi:plasmid stabilization system protein ParE